MVEIEVGLAGAPGNPSLAFIAFVGLALLAVLSARFTVYAALVRRASELPTGDRIWATLVGVGVAAGLYAVLGLVEVVTSLATPYRLGLAVAHVLLVTVAVWLLTDATAPGAATATGTGSGAGGGSRTATGTGAGTAGTRGRGTSATDGGRDPLRRLAAAGAAASVLVFLGGVVLGDHLAVSAVAGLSGVGLAAVGLGVGYRGVGQRRVRGTVVDALLRHLLPVLLFASLLVVAELAVVAGALVGVAALDRAVVLHVRVVFVLVAATALMTATIKLRQTLAGL